MSDARLDVLVVNDQAARVGGIAPTALGTAVGLARRGHGVTLLAGQGEPEPDLAAAGVRLRHTHQNTTLDDPNRLRAAAQGVWNPGAAAALREVTAKLDRRRAVIHIHAFTKVLSPSVIRAAVRSGVPTVVSLHDYFAACPNGAFFNYQTERICELTPLSRACIATHCDARRYEHKLWRVTRSAVQRAFGDMPSGVRQFIAPSRSAARVLEPFLPAAARVEVVPNPIELRRMPPAPVTANEGFVCVGRLQRDKGGVLLANAARRAGVAVTFVGSGEQEPLIRRANPDAVVTGWLTRDAVRDAVRGARAVVNASLVLETQGLSSQEAAAEGVPSIVSTASVASETVADGVTGLLFGGGDVEALAQTLSRLRADPHLAGRLGAAAYERFWSAPHGLDAHLDRLEEIYAAMLAVPPS